MLTMHITADALAAYRKETRISDGSTELGGLRLGTNTTSDHYLSVFQDGDNVILRHLSDQITVFDANLTDVANTVMDFTENLNRLAADLNSLVDSGSPLQSLVDRSLEHFRNPVFIVDETNTVRARTNHIPGTVNDDWDYIVQNGRMPLERVRTIYNSNPSDWFSPACLTKPFLYRPPGMTVRSINYRIPSTDRNKFIGTLIILENETPISAGMLQYSALLADAVTYWVTKHRGERLLNTISDMLLDLLSGTKIPVETLPALEHIVHGPGGVYRLACAASRDAVCISQYRHMIDENLTHCVCCEHEDFLVMLFDDTYKTENLKMLDQLFKDVPVDIGVSTSFSDLKHCASRLLQAKIAVRCGDRKISELNAESVMRYIAIEATSVLSTADLVHPALKRLFIYDSKHGTHMFETLHVFLRNERRLSESLLELGIHRNSLVYRLERIRQIGECDLEDADTRDWLMFSFRMAEFLPSLDTIQPLS